MHKLRPRKMRIFSLKEIYRKFIWRQQQKCDALGGSPTECGMVESTMRLRTFIPGTSTHPSGMVLPKNSVSNKFQLVTSAMVADAEQKQGLRNGKWLPQPHSFQNVLK